MHIIILMVIVIVVMVLLPVVIKVIVVYKLDILQVFQLLVEPSLVEVKQDIEEKMANLERVVPDMVEPIKQQVEEAEASMAAVLLPILVQEAVQVI